MGNSSVFSIVGVTVALALGGCVADGVGQSAPSGPAGQPVPDAAGPASFDESTGAIEGLVTDDQLQPLPGAQVGLLELPGTATLTDVAGKFVFSNLQPGKYQISANALGYSAIARAVDVQAGAATPVNFALTPLPVLEPYHELFVWSGMIECGLAAVRTTLSAGCDPTNEGTNFMPLYGSEEETPWWPTTWNATLLEAEWDSQAQPDWLAFDYNDRNIGYFGVYARYRGTSPFRFLVERCGSYMDTDFGRAPVPCTDEAVNASGMHVETFYNGKMQEETHNFDSICRENVSTPVTGLPGYQAGCYGVGPALQVRWTNYVTIFHLEMPAEIEKYSGRPDG